MRGCGVAVNGRSAGDFRAEKLLCDGRMLDAGHQTFVQTHSDHSCQL